MKQNTKYIGFGSTDLLRSAYCVIFSISRERAERNGTCAVALDPRAAHWLFQSVPTYIYIFIYKRSKQKRWLFHSLANIHTHMYIYIVSYVVVGCTTHLPTNTYTTENRCSGMQRVGLSTRLPTFAYIHMYGRLCNMQLSHMVK